MIEVKDMGKYSVKIIEAKADNEKETIDKIVNSMEDTSSCVVRQRISDDTVLLVFRRREYIRIPDFLMAYPKKKKSTFARIKEKFF